MRRHRVAPELGAQAVGVPRPIPGGIQPPGLGIEVFHPFPPGTSEPDTITEFQQLRSRWRCRGAGAATTPVWSFEALGRRDTQDLAVSLMASYERSALLTNTFRDPDILASEASSQPLDRHAL